MYGRSKNNEYFIQNAVETVEKVQEAHCQILSTSRMVIGDGVATLTSIIYYRVI